MSATEDIIRYKCTKVGSRLRVRVTSPGYNPYANCQFPRDIRLDGREYTTPRSALKFAESPRHKFFYRVTRKQDITIVTGKVPTDLKKYDKEETCCICIDAPPSVIFYRCGHFTCCKACAAAIMTTTKKCPLCRSSIDRLVEESELQTE